MGEYVRQHWIPESYLEAWCDPDPECQNPRRVYRYGIDGRYVDYRPPSRIFTSDDLYTVPRRDGSRDLRTEHALNKLEDSFARTRKDYLLDGKPLPLPARRDLVWFIAALRNRSPENHAYRTGFYRKVLKLASSMDSHLRALSSEEQAEWDRNYKRTSLPAADETSVPLRTVYEMAHQSFGEYLPLHIIIEAQLLEKMQLTIFRVPVECSLITSDRPVVWWDPRNPPTSRLSLGLRRPTIEITVPLTPFLCAQISHRQGPDYADIDAEGVDILNMRTLNQANELFIAHRRDLMVEWLDNEDIE